MAGGVKVTIGMCVKNAEATVKETIKSLLNKASRMNLWKVKKVYGLIFISEATIRNNR